MKPLEIKNYGSIPHLPGSRLGPGDHTCSPGHARIATERVRDKHDEVFVQEKLDGSNVGVARINGVLVPLTRAGYKASSSPHVQHHLFHNWVWRPENYDRFMAVLSDGERLVGEWLAMAHGTRYKLKHEPFVAFDLMTGQVRLPYDRFMDRIGIKFWTPFLIHRGPSLSINGALDLLLPYGGHGALDIIEGAVWRVERKGSVDFLVKYVRPDKVDGLYFDKNEWNWSGGK